MRSHEFDHLLAAAAQITGLDEFVVIGSQAILGSRDDPPQELLESMEADLYPLADPAASDNIDGALGDGSQFHVAFGYYAHGVGPETAKAPPGWQGRLVERRVPPRPGSAHRAVAWCLEAHDLVLSKCAAGRERDWEYARHAIAARMVQHEVLMQRALHLPIPKETRDHVIAMLSRMASPS
ncbi:MAG: DUF6036 family nucleotidyltransferase [Solirubrobacteraceae bacterium]